MTTRTSVTYPARDVSSPLIYDTVAPPPPTKAARPPVSGVFRVRRPLHAWTVQGQGRANRFDSIRPTGTSYLPSDGPVLLGIEVPSPKVIHPARQPRGFAGRSGKLLVSFSWIGQEAASCLWILDFVRTNGMKCTSADNRKGVGRHSFASPVFSNFLASFPSFLAFIQTLRRYCVLTWRSAVSSALQRDVNVPLLIFCIASKALLTTY